MKGCKVLTFKFLGSAHQKLVENVESPLFPGLSDDPGFFQQVGLWKRSPVRRCPGVRLLKFNQVLTNISTRDVTTGVEVDSDEFSLKIWKYFYSAGED